MIKQILINRYFRKLCSVKFFKNDDEEIIGKVKDVIQNLKNQMEYVSNSVNKFDNEEKEFIVTEANELISKIDKKYFFKNNVIKVALHPMAGFYVLKNKKDVFEELRDYYKDMKKRKKMEVNKLKTNIISVKYEDSYNSRTFEGKEYFYFTKANVKIGDLVEAPTQYGVNIARVSKINITEYEIEKIKPYMKTITRKINRDRYLIFNEIIEEVV